LLAPILGAYRAVMASRLLALMIDAHDPDRLARFWTHLLSRDIVEDAGAVLLPGEEGQLGLGFVRSGSERVGPDRTHLHLTSSGPDHQQRTVATALDLGGGHLDVGQRPEEGHIVLADPEGNAFCVIEAGNAFLEGCGPLGELACDGTREVGLFWSKALGWPLVWDENEETAIQSPYGGTKIAWGGPPVAPKTGPNRQRLRLVPTDGDQVGEVERLVALGATQLQVRGSGEVELADPDGNEFTVTTG
jgi:catechol 2,3-dioxygenase-like lactoylglutathione lyase family enzyme